MLAVAPIYDNASKYLLSIRLSDITKRYKILMFNKLTKMRMRNAEVEKNMNQIAKFEYL